MKLLQLYHEYMAWREREKDWKRKYRKLCNLELADASVEDCLLAAFNAKIHVEHQGILAHTLIMRCCRNNRPGAPTIIDAVRIVEEA